jgi:hypothetical protein
LPVLLAAPNPAVLSFTPQVRTPLLLILSSVWPASAVAADPSASVNTAEANIRFIEYPPKFCM